MQGALEVAETVVRTHVFLISEGRARGEEHSCQNDIVELLVLVVFGQRSTPKASEEI